MAIEIESKAWVDDHEAVETHLQNAGSGFEFKGLAVREDEYLAEDGVTLDNMDPSQHRLVRIRRSSDGTTELGASAVLTVKDRQFKEGTEINRETEVEVSDSDSARTLLGYLGYTTLICKTKRMRIYRRGQVTVELSRVDELGSFLECECVLDENADSDTRDQAIAAVAEAMKAAGVSAQRVEPRLYLDLLRERLSKPSSP